jgi:hypothetical protein
MIKGDFKLYETKDTDAFIKLDFEAKQGYQPLMIIETLIGKFAGPLQDDTPGTVLMPGHRCKTGGRP